MSTYNTVKNRILSLCAEKKFTINKLANESGEAPSTIKNILYAKSHNLSVITLKKFWNQSLLIRFLFILFEEFFINSLSLNLISLIFL